MALGTPELISLKGRNIHLSCVIYNGLRHMNSVKFGVQFGLQRSGDMAERL
jgi:hypothetical protein